MKRSSRLGALATLGVLVAAASAIAQDEDDGERKMTPAEELAWLLKDGPVHLKTRSWHAASRCYARAVELAPDNFDARYGLATAFTRLDNFRAALDHAAEAEKLRPDHDGAKVLTGELQLALGRHKEARRTLEALQARAPRTIGLARMLGRLNFLEGRYADARPFLAEATMAPKVDPEVHMEHGECCFKLGDYREAYSEYDIARQLLAKDESRKHLRERATTRTYQSRARIRTFGALLNDGLTYEDSQRNMKVTRPAGRDWAFVFPEQKEKSLVCAFASQDDGATVTLEQFTSGAQVRVGSKRVAADDLKALQRAHQIDLAQRFKRLKGWPTIPGKADADRVVNTVLVGTPRDGGTGRVVTQVSLLVTQDHLYRVVITGDEKAMKAARPELGQWLRALQVPK